MIIQISVACAAVAFIWLVSYAVLTMRKGMVTLGETNRTLSEVRNAVHGLTREASQLIHTTNQITRDVKGKIKTIDPLFESVHDVGEAIQNVTESVKKAAMATGDGLHAAADSKEADIQPAKLHSNQVRVKMNSQ
ncbi:DUF948 domain-containing protein [Paenibacillus sp. S150]|uniref:DUF948 domain-containing protein n=1 Tax=Paenibacillus sp. S150 TaxID=2749826 RepID=UPI001C57C482|nr:DUF948 domain-containing protein [Paenibacillus sp. S150]MBW4083085.1 DUF948 domain-containing protein [Paenibacillus sp. S150]